jgi:hypothetical protein
MQVGRDAGGIGGIMANVAVNGQNYVSGSAWRCFYTATQTEMSAHDMQLWEGGEMDAPPSNWMTATFNDALWPAADDMFVLGTGPWGGGHNANFPPTAQWMRTSESVGHNDIFCRILVPCGTDVLYAMDFEGMGDVQEAFYGQGVGTPPASAVLAADAERGTSAKTGTCIGGGDAYSIETFMCTFDEPCLVTYWQKGNAWQGFAEGFPGPHTWTAVPDDYPGQHISTRKTSTWSYVQYVFPTARIDSGAPDDGSTGLDVHVHGGGETGAQPLRFMFEAFSGSSSGAGSLCDNTWFDDIMITPTLPPVPPTSRSSAWMLRITASGIGAGPGEKLASGTEGSNGQVAPVSAGCGSTATPSTLPEVLLAVSTHTVEIVSSSLAPPHPLWALSAGSFSYDARRSRRFSNESALGMSVASIA